MPFRNPSQTATDARRNRTVFDSEVAKRMPPPSRATFVGARGGVRPTVHSSTFGRRAPGMGMDIFRGKGIATRGGSALAKIGPPPKSAAKFAMHGKFVAGAVAAGLGVYAASRNSGRGTTRTTGRPTGMYGY